MSFNYTRTITVSGYGMPIMSMMSMRPMLPYSIRRPLFGGYYSPMGGYAMCGAVLAGACTGALLANPQTINGIYNYVLKPIGTGAKWLWDNTLGRIFSKKKKSDDSQTSKA